MVLHRRGAAVEAALEDPTALRVDDFQVLLRLARDAVEASVRGHRPLRPDPDQLPAAVLRPAAAFVTLHERGELRGCMGHLDWERAAWENVIAAGTVVPREDPRFMPVAPAELSEIRLEVSVLAPPVELPSPSEFDAGSAGIIVERGGRRALLLPQVAEEFGWDSVTTLEAVCEKAGLPGGAWHWPGTRLHAFRAVRASEPGFEG
ncbi:MAG: AmmeMemoRadiSam system protein A [Chloroflexi bacterium]|nr:AmmeMemoRadiSam system protein A [Chloroflexota bacterium]